MAAIPFLMDESPSASTAMKVPAFPWLRFDAGRFVWEEAFHRGNLLAVHHSAMGRVQSKENIFQKLVTERFPLDHLLAFELEVDGELLRDGFQWQGVKVRQTEASFHEVVVTLAYDTRPVVIDVHTLLDGSEFLTRWLRIRNTGDKPVGLSRVAPWSGIIAADEQGTSIQKLEHDASYVLGRFQHEKWLMEGDFQWQPLAAGAWTHPSPENKYHPALYVVRNDRTGAMTLLQVECTFPTEVTFIQALEPKFGVQVSPWPARYVFAKAGLSGRSPLRVLDPGEAVTTPAIHLGMVQGDLDAGVNALHAHQRRSVMPSPADSCRNLVEYNHTGYTSNAQVSRDLLCKEVDMAAAIGVELFVVDAGWFGPADKSWIECFGDWRETPLLGDGGLQAVFDYARQRGMKCGLWLPPEIVATGSAFFRDRPEWFVRGAVPEMKTFNLLIPEVEEYVYNTICSVISRYNLDCYRIDGGTSNIGERLRPDGIRESQSWRYYDRLFRIYSRVRERFPNLIMENCSGGGGRCDLAMMRLFHHTQISDNWSPDDQIRILNGMTLALTPEQCMPLIGSINMRAADIDFVIRTGLFGHFTASGVFPSLPRSNGPTLERWRHGIALYKQVLRPLLPSCRVFHHTPIQPLHTRGDWVVLEYAAADQLSAVAGIFRLTGPAAETFIFRPRGLEVSKDYHVTFDNCGQTMRIAGGQLCFAGIPIRLTSPLSSELLVINAAD